MGVLSFIRMLLLKSYYNFHVAAESLSGDSAEVELDKIH